MKVRTGFVSNSSSSSFIMVGFSTAHGSYDWSTLPKGMGLYDSDGHGEDIVGVKYSADGVDELSVKEVLDAVYLVKCAFGEDKEIKVFFGEEAC